MFTCTADQFRRSVRLGMFDLAVKIKRSSRLIPPRRNSHLCNLVSPAINKQNTQKKKEKRKKKREENTG